MCNKNFGQGNTNIKSIETRKGRINRVRTVRDQTSSMGLFLGMLEASTTLIPVLRTAQGAMSDVSRESCLGLTLSSNIPILRAIPDPELSDDPPVKELTLTVLLCT